MIKKFFGFCSAKNRNKFYKSAFLGVLEAMFTAMKIPAAFFAIGAVLSGEINERSIMLVIALMLVSTLGKMVINRFSSMLQTEAGYDTCALKRIEIGEHLRYLPMGYFNDTSLGHITSVTTNTMEQTGDIATRAIMMVLQGSITTVVVALFMFAFDYRIGLISLAGIGVFLIVNQWTNRSVAKVADEKLSSDRDMVGVILEYIQGIAEVKAFRLTGQRSLELNTAIDENEHANSAMELKLIPFMTAQSFWLKAIGTVIVLASVLLHIGGSMDLLTTIIMIISSYLIYAQLDNAGKYSALLRTVDVCERQAQDVLSTPQMDISGRDISPEHCDISAENISFAYEQKKIIDGVSLRIPEHTATAIVGPSGGGKTTLTSLLSRFWDVDEGKVTLDGTDVREYSMDALMRNFSFVFQSVYLFADTVANNIRFGQPDAPMEKVMDAAKKACCHDFIMQLPDGYDTVIGEGGASLSGGEKQRISIARAIMKDAPVIVLDEATANVDPENETELMKAIEALTKEKTIIMIAHRLKTVRHADQILVIENGRIVQQGTHDSLMTQDGIYRTFVESRREAASWRL